MHSGVVISTAFITIWECTPSDRTPCHWMTQYLSCLRTSKRAVGKYETWSLSRLQGEISASE